MTRFIFFCMAFVALSFVAVPVFTGISKERDMILAATDSSLPPSDSLSFDAIYDIAATDNAVDSLNPSALNNITPAAGGEFEDKSFSNGFSGVEDSALENSMLVLPDDAGMAFE